MLTSCQNPRIKQVLKLRKRSEREKTQTFIIEGYREIKRAQEAKWPINMLFVSRDHFLGTNEQELIDAVARSIEIIPCSKRVFEKIAYRDRPDGLLAVAPIIRNKLNGFLPPKGKRALIVVAEAIEKPGNLGTILRSCDAAGADCLIVVDKCTDLFNPNVVRASVGTLFTVNVFDASSKEALRWLKRNNIAIVAATPGARDIYTCMDLTGDIAIAFGTEQLGLSAMWLRESCHHVRIPMLGRADSLNVAAATTIMLYEAVRQRNYR